MNKFLPFWRKTVIPSSEYLKSTKYNEEKPSHVMEVRSTFRWECGQLMAPAVDPLGPASAAERCLPVFLTASTKI